MEVFLSYGHDHSRWIVEMIGDDLRAAGYDHVWFDNERITPSDDWRRAILDTGRLAPVDAWILDEMTERLTQLP